MDASAPTYGTAVHEAAHAVIGRLLDLGCGGIDLDEDEEGYGSFSFEPLSKRGWPEQRRLKLRLLTSYCITFTAGAEAEREITGRSEPEWSTDDDHKIRHYCAEGIEVGLPGYPRYRHLRHMRRISLGLVRRHRKTIELVAEALHERGKLGGDEVDEMVRATVQSRQAGERSAAGV